MDLAGRDGAGDCFRMRRRVYPKGMRWRGEMRLGQRGWPAAGCAISVCGGQGGGAESAGLLLRRVLVSGRGR
ncbi:hypothetical protein AWB61_12485 [Chromobacterium sp. F49]|nr:hypothetical protein Cv017_07930 [Chromobacterium subtsugae]KZE87160.1 hypothetical protein AWB61_12485 [Chromobacterium sp. F49]